MRSITLVGRGRLQADDVDAAEHDAGVALLEHDGARLERPAVAARGVDLADEAEHRQAERRIERQGGGSGSHQYIRKPPLTLIVAPEM